MITVVTAGCLNSGATKTRALTTGCQGPAKLVESGEGRAVRLGPLWFLALGSGGTAHARYVLGTPTKVLIRAFSELTHPVALSGRRCADGRPLRLWYRGGLPFASIPVSEHALRTTGDVIAELQPAGHADYTGYMFFSSGGDWIITARQAGGVVGSFVIRVSS